MSTNSITHPSARPLPVRGYLQNGVKIEPLADRWYAWSHLMAPAQHAMNVAFRYLPIMKSFIASPSVHLAASRDPQMFGGPFVSLDFQDVPAARAYVQAMEELHAISISFAHEFREFDHSLTQSASGFALRAWYDRLPPQLRGNVELTYDLNNNPRIRILEEILDLADLNVEQGQEILLHRQHDSERPFFLSTPRIGRLDGLLARRPFSSEAVRRLCTSRNNETDVVGLANELGVAASDLAAFFEAEPTAARSSRAFDGEGVRIRYFGHACVLVETRNTSILIDPTFSWDTEDELAHFTYFDLPPKIDILLISHSHHDHFNPESLIQLRGRVGRVVVPAPNRGDLADPSLARILRKLGYSAVETLYSLDQLKIPDGGVTSLPFTGEHADLDILSKQCFLIEILGRRIAFFIDSDAIDSDVYARLVPQLLGLDSMFVGMECNGAPLSWLYGPLSSSQINKRNDESRRLSGANCEQAWRLTERIQPRRAFVYAMGQEPWMRFMMGLNYSPNSIQISESNGYVAKCQAAGIEAARLHGKMETIL